jgi:hypothetical protein
VSRLREKIEPLKKGDSSVLISAGGDLIRVQGRVVLSLKMGGLTIPYEFLVVKPLTEDLG